MLQFLPLVLALLPSALCSEQSPRSRSTESSSLERAASRQLGQPNENVKSADIVLHTVKLEAGTWLVLAIARGLENDVVSFTPEFEVKGGTVTDVKPKQVDISRKKAEAFYVKIMFDGSFANVRLNVRQPATDVVLASASPCPVIPLSGEWQTWLQPGIEDHTQLTALPDDDVPWETTLVPEYFDEIGVRWYRKRVFIPPHFEGVDFTFDVGAIDDADATFFNGTNIGTTWGWDKPRSYNVPSDLIRWGATNTLVVAVHNANATGGLYKPPIRLVPNIGTPPAPLFRLHVLSERDRRPPRTIAAAQPLRPMVVRDGVLEYERGGEVNLWGVNYYLQTGEDYRKTRDQKLDHRKAIEEDFDHWEAMGVESIRMHVFDTEISDRAGNILENDHLDLIHYIFHKANEKQIYIMLTPIAWWWSWCRNDDAFSLKTPKDAYPLWPDQWPILANYYTQFLTHVSPYTKRRLVEEPCLSVIELFNERTHTTWAEITTGTGNQTYEMSPERIRLAHDGIRANFARFLPGPEWQTKLTYEFYTYVHLRDYIDTMVEVIRQTGSKHPVAFFKDWWHGVGSRAYYQVGVADSRADIVTVGQYPGGLPEDTFEPVNDGKNVIAGLRNISLEDCFHDRPRAVYEFDAANTLDRVTVYPVMARYFRHLGVQMAHQFQYDPISVGHVNAAWQCHYLNYLYTPRKAASFMIFGEAFKRIPRGEIYAEGNGDHVFGVAAVSHKRNVAILCDDDIYMQTGVTDWSPLPIPAAPSRVVAIGNCPFFDYDGNGIVDLRIDGKMATLRVNPDVVVLRKLLGEKSWHGAPLDDPLRRLEMNERNFRMKMPVWRGARVERVGDDTRTVVHGAEGNVILEPGTYRLLRN